MLRAKLMLVMYGMLVCLVCASSIHAEMIGPKGSVTLVYQEPGVTVSIGYPCDWVVMSTEKVMYWGPGQKPSTLEEVKLRATGNRKADWSWFVFSP